MPVKRIATPIITFKTVLVKVGASTIVHVPRDASAKLSSRGQAMIKGTFNGVDFQTPMEPDGQLSHYFKVDPKLLKTTNTKVGDVVSLTIQPIKDWPEPEVPADWQKAIAASTKVTALWPSITPMARWEWIRWARATNNSETAKHRIEVGISKMERGERRPCCWNRNLSTEPDVSKNGILLEPTA
ncbi:MAG TPA: YdeI/OmpD-associated family protein [Candidatus Saccharimonadales bacterium]|nr:YdeI/OmpD-associated family protein [Candidatus Saccharimonadales bacterium]